MTLTRRGRSGSDSFLENFASAEALAQASKASEAIYTYTYEDDSDVYWMPDTQRLENNPDLTRLPVGGRAVVARRTDDVRILTALASDPSLHVRHAVANNELTPDEIRNALTKEGLMLNDIEEVARNSGTPAETLVALASDDDDVVRSWVARNMSTPGHILAGLSVDSNWDIRRSVAMNESTPRETLLALAKDPDEDVRGEAKTNPSYKKRSKKRKP